MNKLYTACRTCYNAGKPEDMWKELHNTTQSPEDIRKQIKLLQHVLDSGHHSVLEHVTLTFFISGVSRSLTHQLVRHRLCSFSQQSQRYVEFKDGNFEYVIPKSIEDNDEALAIFEKFMECISDGYDMLIKEGIPAEDARAILPNACASNITVSLNLRELIHICNERLCTCAQLEIRQMVKEMVKCTVSCLPYMKEYLVPKCEALGYCNENKNRSCGRKKTRDEIFGE